MPASDTWPCDVSMEPLVSMNSAGSCDSVVSTNSGFSDDSMEHLSAEERASIMFLVETIESLEAEDDSGVSNDEIERVGCDQAAISPMSQSKLENFLFHDNPNKGLGKDHNSNSVLVPTPLVVVNGSAKILKHTAEISAPEQKVVPPINKLNGSASNSDHPSAFLNAADEPVQSAPNSGTTDPSADLPPSFIPEPPVKAKDSKTKDSPLKTLLDPKPDQKHTNVGAELEMDLIPPPSDFMDEPSLRPLSPAQTPEPVQAQVQPQPYAQHEEPTQPLQPQSPLQIRAQPFPESINIAPPESTTIAPPPGFGGQAEGDKPQGTVTQTSRGPLSPSELDKLRKKASMKKTPAIAPLDQRVPSDKANVSFSCTDGHSVTLAEHSEPKSPPLVAPKPKKFPSKISLKSHKDSGPTHSLGSSGERLIMNQEQVHREALKKLGLLKVDETNSPTLSSSPPNRIPPPHPFNANTFTAPPTEDAAQAQSAHGDQIEGVEMQGKTTVLFPAPSNSEKGGRGSSPKPFEIKSASMESSRVGLKSIPADQPHILPGLEKTNLELSPGQLRRSRTRPASVGNQKDLGIDHLPSESSREPDIRRSLGSSPIPPPTQANPDSQKPPRSHGMISVVFTPNSKNRDDRKQALRKLGLIRD